MSKLKIYVKSILVPVLLGVIVGIIISPSMDYATLKKPPLSPPGIFFPIVWTILYILMGISYGILKSNSLVDSEINSIYYSNLFVNALWPILFFTLKLRFFAFIWILLLLVIIVTMMSKFYNKNRTAGLLQIPYLLWTIFATYLNFFTFLLNR